MYACIPFESERISAIPMIPMLPAKDVSIVLAFLVRRLLKDRETAVGKDIFFFLAFLSFAFTSATAVSGALTAYSPSNGSVSSMTLPSLSFTIRVEYSLARSGLCVTIITSFSRATSLSKSIICTLVTVSSAPVGSSARSMSGLFTSARAIATLCICPPDI